MDGLMHIKVGLYVDRHYLVPKVSAFDPMDLAVKGDLK